MLVSRVAVTAVVLVLSAGVLSGCGSGGEDPDEEQILRLAVTAPPATFDPARFIDGLGFEVSAVYDGLFLLGPEYGDIEPWLATSYSYNEDHTVLTLQIRDDVDFIDGEHLTAEVVKQNIELRSEGDDADRYTTIEEIVVTGEYSVEIHLSQPDHFLLAVMLNKPIVSPAAIDDREGLATNPVGSGPYILESNEADTAYTFVRNPDYWNPEAFPFDRIEMTVMPDITARVNALKSGQIDFAQIDVQTAAEAEESGLETYRSYSGWVGLMLGDRRGEISAPIADLRVRQAIVMALDRQGYADAVGGGLIHPSNQLGVPGQEGYYLPELEGELDYDLEAARALLAEAGYPDGFDLRIPTSTTFLAQYQPYFEQALTDLGIRAEWVMTTDDTWFEEYLGAKNAVVPMIGARWETAFAKQGAVLNPWNNTDAETEELLAQLERTDGAEWLEARTRLTKKIFEEAWFAILAHEPNVFAFDPEIDIAGGNLASTVSLVAIQLD